MADFRRNVAKEKLAEGGVVTVPLGPISADMIEHLGPIGFEAFWLEAEHGPIDFGAIPDLTRACDLWGITSIARVHQNEPGLIYRTMDVGAQGIAVPHIKNAEEARAVVDAAKFAPIGNRGSWTSRQGIGVDDYYSRANDFTLVVVMIEDIVGVKNLDSILKVDHIDVFFVAPGDLAQSMGHLGEPRNPAVMAMVEESVNRIVAAGRVAGTLVNNLNVGHYVGLGVQFLQVQWVPWVREAARAFLSDIKTS
ncbi:MAG: hypothetical protein CMM74_12635 [Rhodospirillaceae bacterium]|nr:hypothetical protein [Rhodospirillaceae bacterium]|tara:strand:+ start:802 stop:1554 length:753 start_codon:yes stop_codon:yes gene_type:complete